MNNPKIGDVSFEAGGQTWTLRYTHLALVKLEDALNKGLIEIMADISKPERLRLGTVAALLWAGLQHHHPDLSRDNATLLLDDIKGGVAGAMVIIDKAFGKAFSSTLGTKGTNPTQKEGNGIGTEFSPSMPVTGIPLKPFGA